ncbi:hypothetical protein [Oceaniovalibus sp. ACAM 378]|uniref:hypothetical protein n=1 Tax=Oceaniovalibus sp. ACAM 378 TaxID=2599923 RepID=UPI0011D938B5|nr:hypothetical protein [Oceaniovalibus sp. ACAM 378]TYB85844.1 hypothetical protein FQ320_18500 [Oceaniovalibus sp. ACAM 378]
MENLIREIEAYAASVDKLPQKVLRDAIGAGWGQWAGWKTRASSPTMASVDRLRAFMAANPPEQKRGAA